MSEQETAKTDEGAHLEVESLRAQLKTAEQTRDEYLALARRMLALGMATRIPTGSIRQRVGLFCVAKGPERLRLIADARRTNAAHREPHTALPNPGFLASIEADTFVAGVQDLSAYYSTLLLPEWLVEATSPPEPVTPVTWSVLGTASVRTAAEQFVVMDAQRYLIV